MQRPEDSVSRVPGVKYFEKSLTSTSDISIIGDSVGGVPERSKGSDCKSDGSAFEGSNPSPSTKIRRPDRLPLYGEVARSGEVIGGRCCAGVAQW